MYSVGINQSKFYSSQNASGAQNVDANIQASSPTVSNPIEKTPQKVTSFTALAASSVRTQFTTKEEQQKYLDVSAVLDKKSKRNLDMLLKNGKLLNNNSNDGSTTLDNLHKMITQQRHVGLNPQTVLKETVDTLANPFVINQKFGDIPKQYVKQVVALGKNNMAQKELGKTTVNSQTPEVKDEINENTVQVERSGACVSASIEYNLASKNPAEFARFAESLTSPKVAVDKTIQMKNLSNYALDGIWLLNAFEVPYKMDNFDLAHLTLAPDKNAIMRAQIQNSHKDPGERSLVDVLMQSTFMNVGSQQAYNSLTDFRGGKFNQDNKGLIEFEKTFTESVVQDKNKISVTYQTVDENEKLVGYETDFKTLKKQILESLQMGENVIIGYTLTDETNKIINGHEITIIGATKGKDGKLIFICNDTDDGVSKAVAYHEDFLVPKIHHAGIPQEIAEKDNKYVDNWIQSMDAYKQAKSELQQNS